jgi:hypothetical protein
MFGDAFVYRDGYSTFNDLKIAYATYPSKGSA